MTGVHIVTDSSCDLTEEQVAGAGAVVISGATGGSGAGAACGAVSGGRVTGWGACEAGALAEGRLSGE